MWQSPDPILGAYLNGGPAGGVFTPPNLNLYGYVHQRPVVATDPDGEFLNFLVGAVAGGAIDLAMQGVLVATGVQDSVSWSSVAVSAASGATGVGLSSVVTKNAARVAAGRTVAVTATMAGETAIGVAGQAALGEDINVTAAVVGAAVGEGGGEAVGALLRRGNVGDAAEVATDAVDLQLSYKEGWTPAQRAAADAKCQALCDATTVLTAPDRAAESARSRYQRAGNSVPDGADVDHIIDLQLGGADSVGNMSPLDASVNRSLGSQIYQQTKDLPTGTVIRNITIE